MDLLHVPPSSHCRSTLDMTLPVSFDFFVSFLSVSRTQFWFYTCLDIISFLSLQTSRLGPLEPLFLKEIIQTTFSLSPLSFCISLFLKCWSDGMFLFFRKHHFYITFFFSLSKSNKMSIFNYGILFELKLKVVLFFFFRIFLQWFFSYLFALSSFHRERMTDWK